MTDGDPTRRAGGLRARMAGRRPSLTTGFALRAAVAVTLLGVVLHLTLTAMIDNRARTESVRAGELVAQLGIAPHLSDTDLTDGISSEARAALDRLIADAVRDTSLERIKIFDTDAVVVYSDDPSAVGQSKQGDPLVAAALAGTPGSKLVERGHTDDPELGSLLEVFVPLTVEVDGRPTILGVVELYVSYGPTERAVQADTMRLDLQVFLGLGLLYLVLFRLVSGASDELERRASQNEYLARHDQLTGLANRSVLAEQAAHTLARVARHGGEAALVMIDLDGFKEINDTLGHDAGDRLLVEVAARFEQQLRTTDTIARLGGDEFALLLEDTGADGARSLAHRLLQVLEQPISLDDIELVVSGSLGIAVAPHHGTTTEALLRRADVAMYLAKGQGNGVELYDEERDPYTEGQIRLLADLRRAIETRDDDLGLHFQPSVDLRTGEVTGAEALLRWHHAEFGPVAPDRFISLAERTDLIGPLTQHVLDRALLVARGVLVAHPEFVISINISTRNLLEPDLVQRVERALERSRVPAENLRFELTETALMADPNRALSVLRELRRIGVRIGVDDFGTGYSSLSYLQRLPVDELKIDRGFVRDLADSIGDQLIVQSTIVLANNLGLRTVAEGVEDGRSLSLLHRLGCDRVQGYHIARPMPAEELLAWIADWSERPAAWIQVP